MRVAVAVPAVLCAVLVNCESNPTKPLTASRPLPDVAVALAAAPTESAADDISANIQRLHLLSEFPNPTIVDPRFGSDDPAEAGYTTVVGYAHAGDAAIWTGHYLAAEAKRFEVTRSSEALANAQRALDGIEGLVDVTAEAMPGNPGLLARFLWPDSWWYADRMATEEGSHGVYRGTAGGVPQRWLGNTSRDQYSGVFFGLAVAFDAFELVDDPKAREKSQRQIRRLVTRMLDFLLRNGWNVPMPNGSYSTTFLIRPDQQLTLLQIGRHVNPKKFELIYQAHRAAHAVNVITPMAVECQDPHGGYYKFNLNHINLFNLIRLEDDVATRAVYMTAFDVLRGCTAGRVPPPPGHCPNPDHENAHFNMIERALQGPHGERDLKTREYLGLWLERPRRDYPVDHTDKELCHTDTDRAVEIIPINERVNTDFLWQRSPFLVRPDREPTGTIETAAIDYLLPYWMARHYRVIEIPTIQ